MSSMHGQSSRNKRRKVSLPIILVIVVVFAAIGAGVYLLVQPKTTPPAASTAPTTLPTGKCAPNAILVNPCRPWFGAAANGNPGASRSKIAQFNYVERLIGRPLDIFRDYHALGGSGTLGQLPLNSTELQIARRPHTYLDINWKPATTFAQADGGDPAINTDIRRVAASVKSVAPKKLFLTIWWEPQHDVTGGTNCPVKSGAVGGTPAQYIAMWRNVERIFRAEGVTNVVWAMDYQAPATGQWDCLVPQLWPGNKLVDWVLYDTYSRNSQDTWTNTVGRFYYFLSHESSPRVDFDSKPWGVGEFGTCSNNDSAVAQDFYLEAKSALAANDYPRLKMYLAYEDTGGPAAGKGCLSDYNNDGTYDRAKQANFNQFASAVLTHN
jgi:Glycosyl hydrolase family 26